MGLLVAGASLVLIAWLSLHWFILPHIQQWRAPIEAHASRALGATVQIGRIDVRSSGWVPGIELYEVAVLDAAGRVALRLPRVVATLSPRSLLALDLRFEQLLVEGAELEVRRAADGRIFVAGLDVSGSAGGDEGAAEDWLFRQRELVIRGAALRWVDEQRAAPPLALTDLQLVVRNSLRRHAIRLDATPPPGWGERFTFEGRFTQRLLGRPGDWKHWSGTVYANLPRADVGQLKQHVELPFELSEGDGALRGWFEVRDGEPHAATIDLALRAVSLRLAADVEPLVFERVEGRLEGQRDGETTRLALRGFGFVTGDGVRWPQGDLALTLNQRAGADPTGGVFSAQRLDVGVMTQIATRVPLGAPLRKLLADVDPRGVVSDFAAQWEGALDAPEHYDVKGRMSGLALAPRASAQPRDVGRPGVRNASLELHATESGGEARLEIADGSVELPGVFAEPVVPLDRFSARLAWKIERPAGGDAPARLQVQVRDAKFANADARGDFAATWSSGDSADAAHGGRYPGRLELDGRLTNGVATRVARYLPLGIPEGTRRYVAGAVRGGTVKSATFHVKGHLRDFPFHTVRTPRDGEFRIAAVAENGTFAFLPDAPEWPALTQVAGELVVDRATLEIRQARARSGALDWSGVGGAIRDLGERPVLTLDATARGPLAEMLKVVNGTPVGGWIDRSLAKASATGPAELQLGLGIPLDDAGATSVRGSLALPGNDVRLGADTPLLAAAKGRVDFTRKGFTVVGATARVLGGEAAFEGGTQADDSIRFVGQGVATGEGLRRSGELGVVARVARVLDGQAAYRVNLGFERGRTRLLVTSDLVGMAADLPAPLGKAAAAPLELRYQTSAVDEGGTDASAARERLRLDLGGVLQASYLLEHAGGSTRVLSGGIGVNAPAPTPASGVAASVVLQRLDVDAWEAVQDRVFGSAGGVPASVAAASGAGSGAAAGAAAAADDYVPDSVALRAQELKSGSRRLTNVTLGASDAAGLWRANVSADQLEGYVEFRPSRLRFAAVAGPGPGRVYARLSRLSLPKGEVDQVETLLEQPPTAVPALDIVVDELELRGRHLGRMEVEAANRIRREPGREPVREWRLAKLNLTMPEARLVANGTWGAGATAGATKRAAMDFRLIVADSGELLQRLGVGKAISGGKGELSGSIGWAGSPLSPDYPSLSGQVNVAIDSGQFLKAEPGAARLLSVLSLQSLPRRLAFDFRDLFEKGFAFDSITGDVTIAEGVARTNNLRMRGPAAVVLMEGSADIIRETEDLRVVVVPEINAGTASLAYAIINPAVGLGTFLAQYFLRKPLIEAGTREFRVTGPWDDPKLERVERRRAQNLSAAEPPATAASATSTR
jgi:uncharacterized protein (TIGR02099 family)